MDTQAKTSTDKEIEKKTNANTLSIDFKVLEAELSLLRDEKLVLFLGAPTCGKSTIIQQLFDANDLSIASQYDIGFGIVTEFTSSSIPQHAARNMRYFQILKDFNRKTSLKAIRKKIVNALDVNQTLASKPNLSRIRNYDSLYSGFMRRFEDAQDGFFPRAIIELIEKYYFSNKLLITSYKSQFTLNNRGSQPSIYNIWESCGIHTDYWVDHHIFQSLSAFIYVVDLTAYDKYFVDESGAKVNVFSYSLQMWKAYTKRTGYSLEQILMLTKKDLFSKKLKKVPLNVCPIFRDYDGLNTLGHCTDAIKKAFEGRISRSRRVVICNGHNQENMQRFFKALRARI